MSTKLIASDFIKHCRGKDYKISSRLEALYYAFGWQGGTIHQLAEATGLNINQLMDLDKNAFYTKDSAILYTSEYNKGWFAGRTCSIEFNIDTNFNMAIRKGHEQFWQGVANGIFME